MTGEAYYAFTLADLQAGNVAFLAGDGLQSGDGERITFKVQAVDDQGNLSDSDPNTANIMISTGCGRKTSESFVLLGHLAGHDAGDR